MQLALKRPQFSKCRISGLPCAIVRRNSSVGPACLHVFTNLQFLLDTEHSMLSFFGRHRRHCDHYAKWGDTCTMMCAVTSGSHRSQIQCPEQQFQILPCVSMWETAIACTFGVSPHPAAVSKVWCESTKY